MTNEDVKGFYAKYGDKSRSAGDFVDWICRSENGSHRSAIADAYNKSMRGDLGVLDMQAVNNVMNAFYSSPNQKVSYARNNLANDLYNGGKWSDYIKFMNNSNS